MGKLVHPRLQRSELPMKHVSQKQHQARLRSAHRRTRKNFRRKRLAWAKFNNRQAAIPGILSRTSGLAETSIGSAIMLPAPRHISLRRNYEEVVQFVNDIRTLVFEHRRKVCIDFNTLERISPAAMLYLTAEFYRCRRIGGFHNSLTGTYPTNPVIANVLDQVGFFELLDVHPPLTDVETAADTDIEYIRYFTSNEAKTVLAKQLRVALTAGAGAVNEHARGRMFAGLAEAMNNAIQHAYLKGLPNTCPVMTNRWWMAGSVDHKRKEFQIIFYDQGVGIPRTLPHLHGRTAIGRLLERFSLVRNDGNLIKAAMELRESRTKQAHRGRGLKDVRDFVDVCDDGWLRILSGYGEYTYHSGGVENIANHSKSIGGTLIQWKVSQQALIEEFEDGHEDSHIGRLH